MYQNADGLQNKVWTTILTSVFRASSVANEQFSSELTDPAEVLGVGER
jgi:hypothetical protein